MLRNGGMNRVGRMLGVLAVVTLSIMLVEPCAQAGVSDEQALVGQAQVTLADFQASPDMGWYRELLSEAEGVLVVPDMYKAGLLLGGSGGQGVLFVRDEETGGWTGPAFYNIGSFTGGLQIGAQISEVVILVMSRQGVDALFEPSVRLGTDASVAAGPLGSGAAGSAAPDPRAAFLSFIRSKGAFIGLTLEGAVVDVGEDANAAYYGRPVRPSDIFKDHSVSSPEAEGIRDELAGYAARKKK